MLYTFIYDSISLQVSNASLTDCLGNKIIGFTLVLVEAGEQQPVAVGIGPADVHRVFIQQLSDVMFSGRTAFESVIDGNR